MLALPVTVAENCCDCEGPSCMEVGETETVTVAGGLRVMVTWSNLDVSASLVARTVAELVEVMVDGAV